MSGAAVVLLPSAPDTHLLYKVIVELSVHCSRGVIPIELRLGGHLPPGPGPLRWRLGARNSGLFAPGTPHQLIWEVLFQVEHVQVREPI